MSLTKTLIVDDDLSLARVLTAYLNGDGFQASSAGSAAEMFRAIDAETFHCMIVDLGLPDEDGIVLIRKLRARSEVLPIIVLTGREGMDNKVASFELGADDYINKPVDPQELALRIRAVLRRQERTDTTSRNILHLDALVLDHDRREAYRKDGALVDLTPAEFSLFWVLANADGAVLSRETLVDAISTGDGPLSFRAVDILISRLRKKIDKDAIRTVSGSGYRCGWNVSRG